MCFDDGREGKEEVDSPFRSSIFLVYLGGLGPGAEDLFGAEF